MKAKNNVHQKTKSIKSSTLMLISCAIIFALTTLVLEPIYINVASDIVFSVTLLPELLEIATDLLDILAFGISYSLVIFSSTFDSSKKTFGLCVIYSLSTIARRTVASLMTLVATGALASVDYFSVGLTLVLEIAQIFLVMLWATSAAKRYYLDVTAVKKAAHRVGGDAKAYDIGFRHVYSKSNPMQNTALKAGIMLSAIKVISRIIYDVSYGAPESLGEVLTMVVYYFSDLLVCVIFYALAWVLLSKLYSKHIQLKAQ